MAAIDFESKSKKSKEIPLDSKEIFRLKSSWKVIKERMPEAGLELFLLYAFPKLYILVLSKIHRFLIENQVKFKT